MKNKYFAITFLLCNFFALSNSFAQAPAWTWAKSAGGNYYDEGSAVTTDNSGNVYSVGYFYNDTIVFGVDTFRNVGQNDLFLVKYNSSGNILWAKHAGGTGDDYASAVTTDLYGNIYVVGWYSSPTIVFGSTVLTDTIVGLPDIFIVKYNPNGNVIWARKEGGTDYDIANGVVTDPTNGQVYLAGAYYNSSITVGTTTLANNGLYDELLVKYDTAGNPLWAKSSGGTLNDLGNAIALDNSGNVYVDGGFASSSMTFGTTTLTNVAAGEPDIFIVKYDSAGNVLWARSDGGIDNDHAVACATDAWGNVFAAGHYHSTGFTFGTSTLTNGGMGDVFILKYDSVGNALWGKSAGGMDMDFGYSVAVDASGNSYFAGMFMSPTITFGTTTLTNASMNQDMFLVKYDSTGNEIWAIGEGGMGDDYIDCVTTDNAGDLYVSGDIGSTSLQLGSSTLTNADTSGSTTDVFVGKLDVVTGANEWSADKNFSIYPNPSNGIFTISGDKWQMTGGRLEIYNALGEKVFEKENVSGNTCEINIGNLSDGIYFLKMISEGKIYEGKIVKE